MNRRRFLELTHAALAVTLMPSCASVAAVRVPAPDGVVRLSLRDHPALLQPGGALKVQPEGGTGAGTASAGGVRQDVASDTLYVLALDDGSYATVSPVCTHRGCIVGVQGQQLVCPCHGSTYARTGEVLRGPAERALRRFPTHVEAGAVLIDLRGEA